MGDLSVWSLHVLPVHAWVFFGISGFLPLSKNMLHRLIGNSKLSIGVNVRKYSHVTLAGRKDQRTFYHTKTWWCGFVFTCIGESANFVSYAFAPLAVVAPLNAVSVLTSSILGFLFLHEKCKPKEFAKHYGLIILGYFITAGGTYLFVSFGPNSHEKLEAENIVKHIVGWPVLLYLLLEIILFCLLLWVMYNILLHHSVFTSGSVTVITVKAVSGMLVLSIEGNIQLDNPIFSVMFVCMMASVIFQARFLSQACKLHDSSLVMSVNYILSTVFAVVAGAVFYLEFNKEEVLNICMYVLGSVLCFLGVFLMTKNRKKPKIFEPYVSMDMSNGVPTIHDKGSVVQPDFNGSFSYGTLVNNDGVAPAPLPVNLEQPVVSSRTSDPPTGQLDRKND
uniref:NIPA like domain containing 3 n=1 Tax=Oryzias latipes TaxID=8090 RepID=A0A3P9M9H5_ORYLA